MGGHLQKRWLRITLYLVSGVLMLALGAWIYALPYLTLSKIRDAAKKGDSEALSELIDFPQLRESVKESFNAAMVQITTREGDNGNPYEVLAMLFANVLVDKFVDAAVSPSGLALLLQGKPPKKPNSEQKDSGTEEHDKEADLWAKASMGYAGLSKFVVRFPERETGRDAVVLTLKRRGLSWQLVAVRLPIMLDALQETIP